MNGSDPSGLLTCVKRSGTRTSIPGLVSGSSAPFWECDWWGMPANDFEDLRTLFGTGCTALGYCPCQWLEACTTRPPTPAEWAMIRRRIDEIVSSHPICQGTRDILDEWYKEGPNSGRYMIWDGDRSDPRSGELSGGEPTGTGIALSHDFLLGNRSRGIDPARPLVLHEGLHIFANRYLTSPTGLMDRTKWGDSSALSGGCSGDA